MSTTSITQQVIKYCQMGFYPICKLQNGQYQVFTPFQDDDGDFRCSYVVTKLYKVNGNVGCSYVDFDGLDDEYTPTEIIGFYHHPFKPFVVGDRVVCKAYKDRLGNISEIDTQDMKYKVKYDDSQYNSGWYLHYELEPYLGQTPKKQPLKLTLKQIAQRFGVEVGNLKII